MPQPAAIRFLPATDTDVTALAGRIALVAEPGETLSPTARRLDKACRGALSRAIASPGFGALKSGEALELAFPAGLAAESVQVVRLARRADVAAARLAGAAMGKAHAAQTREQPLTVIAAGHPRVAEIAFGLALRSYRFDRYRTTDAVTPGAVSLLVRDPEATAAAFAPMAARVEGVHLARDLVSEPANVLDTSEFARRLAAMAVPGLKVEILEEEALKTLGMRALLAVGQGSASPSRVAILEWRGLPGSDEAPVALVGKGVCFDTGGISIKPAAGMEEMTMDMGGAATVAGVMHVLARRGARVNAVGLVGLVENMPDGAAQRPGDVVRSLKGDTIEVINTDAEGRLVLADVLWHAQERFRPRALIDLATLTGAVIVALGHENAGVFSNDDALCEAFLAAARAEGEGAWRLPLGDAYDRKLKSRIADMVNSCGREAGSVTAAQFLQRFVRPGVPWIHLDIAGTAYVKADTDMAPKGPTGWGVLALDRLIRDRFERP